MKIHYALKKFIPAILIIAILATGFFGVFGIQTVKAVSPQETFTLSGDYYVLKGVNIIRAVDSDGNVLDQSDYAPGKTLPAGTVVTTRMDQLPKFDTVISSEEKEGIITGCSLYPWRFHLSKCLSSASAWIGQGVLTIFSLFVGFAGWILDHAVVYTIVNMGDNIDKIGFITEGWKIFRDLANIILIFVLLAIGIATILRLEQYGMKALLAKLIIVALLINFSLFFTQVIIDASNIIALQFYEQITEGGSKGVGSSYMQAFQLATLFDSSGAFSPQTLTGDIGFGKILLISILGSVVFLVATFVFLAGAFLLLIRYVALVFLMVLAPLAFVGMILPALSVHAKKWWSYLFNYSFFAPIYLLLTWFVINVINSPAFKNSLGLKTGDTTFANLGAGGAKAVGAIPILVNFILVIIFIIASLIIAQQLGIAGSSTVIKWGQSARKWGQGFVAGTPGRFARNTIGRGASKMASSEKLKERAAQSGMKGTFNRIYLKGLQGAAGSSLDFRSLAGKKGMDELGKGIGAGGYEEKLKRQVKAREKFAESLGKESIAEKQRKGGLKSGTESAKSAFEAAQGKEKKAMVEVETARIPEYKKIAEEKLETAIKEREAAETLLKAAKFAEAKFKPGTERQKSYAGALEKEKTIDTVFIKVPRKGKEAAQKIRDNIDKFKEKKILDSLKEAIEKESEPKPEAETES